MGDERLAKRSVAQRVGGEEARKIEHAMGGLCYDRSGQSGRRMENYSRRQKELETVNREHSERKVRRGNKRQRKDDSNHGQPHP